jgi:hypothetical protein
MFLLYHSDRCNTSETVFHWCYVNELHTTHAVVCWVTTARAARWMLCRCWAGRPWQSGRLQQWWPEVREDLPVSRAWTRMVRWPPRRDSGSPRSSSGRRLPRPARVEELHLELLAASYPTNSSSCCCRPQL